MPRLEEIKDVKTLQQVAFHLEKTTVRQSEEIARLRAQIARLRGRDVDPQMELDLLKEQLAAMQRTIFGESSERRPSGQRDDEVKPEKPRRGHGPTSQPDLPIEVVNHTLEEDDRKCPVCGDVMDPMPGDQAEESEEITVITTEYKILKHRRQVYCCGCGGHAKTASGPARLIPGGRYSTDFAVHVAEQKYLDHLPLERQARAMGRAGLEIGSQTLWDQIDALARHLEPTYDALCVGILENELVCADETYWRNHENKNTSKWWTWCVTSDDMSVYRIERSRSKDAAENVLGGFKGIVMTDGYGAYKAIEREVPDIQLAHCWAHVRRKFLEAEDAYPQLSDHAVKQIKKLFKIEKETPRAGPNADDEKRQQLLDFRLQRRHELSKPIIDDLLLWAGENRGRVLPNSKMGKAIYGKA